MNRTFLKMHGLGNDFVIIDGRADNFKADRNFLLAIADRKRGIGCDQIIVLWKPTSPKANVYLDMYNSDGSVQRACGNVTRCVARLLFDETGRRESVIETEAGLLYTNVYDNGMVSADFDLPRLDWAQIPLAKAQDTLHVPLSVGVLSDPCCVSMGNPHAVFFVDDVSKIPLSEIGPRLETDKFFPDRCNIEIVQILAPDRLRMRVWERGAGITEACGTAACASLVAASRRGLSARRATVVMDGGESIVEWRTDDHVILTGPTALSFRGTMNDELFTQARRPG